MNVKYLNTDLELVSENDLSTVIAVFGEDVVLLSAHRSAVKHVAIFEIAGSTADPESIIEYFCMLAESLDEEARAVWDACHSRVVDVGFEGGTDHASYASTIDARTVARMAANGMSFRVTVHPLRDCPD